MFVTYETEKFNQNINSGNFVEIGLINRCKDFKEINVFLGKKYNDIFIIFEDKIYISKEKNIKIQDTIAFFYEIDKDKIMLSMYKCKNNKKVKNLSKILKWNWKDVKMFTECLRLDFLHF
jgi:hypothetical protein